MTLKSFSKLEALIPGLLRDLETPGLAVAAIKDDAVVYAAGFGTRTLDRAEAVDGNTLFAIASMSKSTAGLCLAMLVDEGRLDWNDRVIDYLPDFALADAYATREIRVRDLLMHNSGLSEVSGGTVWYGSEYSREEVVRRMRWLRPQVSFRGGFAYQNICYLVAAQVIKAVSGESWDDMVTRRVFAPLKMTRTRSTWAAANEMDNLAAPHALLRGQIQTIAHRSHDNLGPGASIYSSAWDLAQYARLFINGGRLDGQQLVAAPVFEQLTTPQIAAPLPNYGPHWGRLNPNFRSYGYGWYLVDYAGMKMVYHSGGVDGFRGQICFVPEKKAGVVVLCNQESREAYISVLLTVMDSLLGLQPFDWAAAAHLENQKTHESVQARQKAFESSRVTGTRPSLSNNDYCGVYADKLYGAVNVVEESGHLVLAFNKTPAFTADLEHWHYDTFLLKWRDPYIPDGLLSFPLNSHGLPTRLVFDQPNLLDVDFNELDLKRME